MSFSYTTWRALGIERIYLWQRCSDGSVNKTILKPRLAAAAGRQYVYVWFSRRKIPHSSAYTISEKAIRFRHPDYNLDWAQKLISSSMSRRLSTRNISSKSVHAFLSNLANRQTDKHGQKHLPPSLSEVTSHCVWSVMCRCREWDGGQTSHVNQVWQWWTWLSDRRRPICASLRWGCRKTSARCMSSPLLLICLDS